MGLIFSRIPVQQILVAGTLGIFSGFYIFAPGIIEYSKKNDDEARDVKDNVQKDERQNKEGNE